MKLTANIIKKVLEATKLSVAKKDNVELLYNASTEKFEVVKDGKVINTAFTDDHAANLYNETK